MSKQLVPPFIVMKAIVEADPKIEEADAVAKALEETTDPIATEEDYIAFFRQLAAGHC